MSKYNSYTYMWQEQPYKPWKGDLEGNLFNVLTGILKKPINNAVPTVSGSGTKQSGRLKPPPRATSEPAVTVGRNSRVANSQNNKLSSNLNPKISGGVGVRERNFGPQPIKHWRLQLNTVSYDKDGIVKSGVYNKKSVANFIDRPGSSYINIKKDNQRSLDKCDACDPSGNGQFGIQYFNREKLWNIDISFNYPNDTIKPQDNSVNPGRPACVACNPENNIIRSAVTLLNKNYYSDTKAYLRSRCKTYDQKLNLTKLANPKSLYLAGTTTPAWPTDEQCGVQTFIIGTCPDKCQSGAELCGDNIPPKPNRATAIYKPSNRPFAQRGPVESSTRIEKLRFDTINTNAASFNKNYGRAAANAVSYTNNTGGGYFVKDSQAFCSRNKSQFVRRGNKNVCTPTPQQLGYLSIPGRFYGCKGWGQSLCAVPIVFGDN